LNNLECFISGTAWAFLLYGPAMLESRYICSAYSIDCKDCLLNLKIHNTPIFGIRKTTKPAISESQNSLHIYNYIYIFQLVECFWKSVVLLQPLNEINNVCYHFENIVPNKSCVTLIVSCYNIFCVFQTC